MRCSCMLRLLSVVVDEDPPLAFVLFDFDGHSSCLLSPVSVGRGSRPALTPGVCYAHASHPGRTLVSFKFTGRGASSASACGVRIACSASATACLQMPFLYIASGQEQNACTSL